MQRRADPRRLGTSIGDFERHMQQLASAAERLHKMQLKQETVEQIKAEIEKLDITEAKLEELKRIESRTFIQNYSNDIKKIGLRMGPGSSTGGLCVIM